jgi:transcriptional regulator with XRE-family HTH domain
MSLLADKLKRDFKTDKDYRHGYADEFLNAFIATQIKVLREQRNWTQHQLAEAAGMKQARISVMENVNYSSWSLNTLRRLAEALDLTLNVSFEDFGKRLADIDRFSRESLERFSFAEDPAFMEQPIEEGQPSHALTEALQGFQYLQRREQPKVIEVLLLTEWVISA